MKTATAQAAAKVIGDAIGDESLLIFTNRDCDQMHIIYPDLSGSRPRLQRMVYHRDQPNRTVVQQVANLWQDYGKSGKAMGEAVGNAFSVQPVTDAFFADYKAAYDDAVARVAEHLGQTEAEQFTQTLFNRLLFVHFVSRKGWLRFDGDVDYLNALWRDYQADDKAKAKNFYTGRLSTLFFAGLNNPQSQNLSNGVQPLIGEVPFLNGGLFEETDIDRRAANAVPDAVIKALLGDGERSGLFNRYNFTVSESTPLDTEVAVDPEMLGRLFEETVNERHSNGAYYTPRPVVAFMCREAIKGYLSGKNINGLDDDMIADLVDNHNPDAITPMQAPAIYEAVKNMKAVDPACGSGAFLLGMLQEMTELNETLFRAGHTPESMYDQKLAIITSNIHGVDKDDLAVSTAMLRLWLSLAVDFHGNGPPKPLPNLDLKLVVGDAVAGPNPDSAALQRDWFKEYAERSSLRQDIAAYTTAYGQRKDTLKQQVESAKAQLRGQLKGSAPVDSVEWRIDFAEVLLDGGFDVVSPTRPTCARRKSAPTRRRWSDSTATRSPPDLICTATSTPVGCNCSAKAVCTFSSAPTGGWMWDTVPSCRNTCSTMPTCKPSTNPPWSGSSPPPTSTRSSASSARTPHRPSHCVPVSYPCAESLKAPCANPPSGVRSPSGTPTCGLLAPADADLSATSGEASTCVRRTFTMPS